MVPKNYLSQISITARSLVGMDIDQLLPLGADPAPVAHQAHGPDQIPLNHEAVEAPARTLVQSERTAPFRHAHTLKGYDGPI
jgi:hypothetical protein